MYRTQHFRRPSKHHRSAFDLDDSDFAEPNLGLDTDSTFTPHRHNPDFEPFKRLSLRVSPRTFQVLRPNELLIVSHSLTHLKIILHSHQRTIRVAVAGDMRLRDVLKQVLPHKHLHDARAYVRSQGGWVEPEAPMKVEDVVELGDFAMNEKEEVEVRIVLGCAKMENGKDESVLMSCGWWGTCYAHMLTPDVSTDKKLLRWWSHNLVRVQCCYIL
jgi:hypothetical protein